MWICIAPCHEHTSKALGYGMHSQGLSQFYLHIPRSSTNWMNHTCLAFPAEAGTHLLTPEVWKAELALVPCGCWPQPTVGCESFARLLLSTLTICYYSACKLILVAVYQSIIRTCCHEVMLDPVSDTGSDRSELDFTRQKITYRDYIGLWTTLLHLTTVKACCSIVWCLSDDAQCNTGWADICTVATCDS